MVLRGSAAQTRSVAQALTASLPRSDVLWIGAGEVDGVDPRRVGGLLGRSFDAVVLDAHDDLDADVLGQCHGMIWGGGALVLRLPPRGQRPEAGQESLAVSPFGVGDVGHRFFDRVERALDRGEVEGWIEGEEAPPLEPVSHEVRGTEEQAEVVEGLAEHLLGAVGAVGGVIADRGRGKSSALGLALAEALRVRPGLRVAVAAGGPEAVREVFRFALGVEGPPTKGEVRFVPAAALARDGEDFDAVIVDEAAQIPVHVLKQIVASFPDAPKILSTTVHGYEGTGRGFLLRFVDRLGDGVRRWRLEAPIRWGVEDRLERLVFDALLLDASMGAGPEGFEVEEVEHVCLDREALGRDEAALRGFFGLLVQAHYRTTPGDLRRLLDAPNIRLHALRWRGEVVAATLVALEGGLSEGVCGDLWSGRSGVRGHALADTLVAHLGWREAGQLKMVRSVRIAVQPTLRRMGLGLRLIKAVHGAYSPDLFGTLFGAEAGLLAFRRSAGYEAVRISASRGSRTGEPSVVMVRPVSEAARVLMSGLRRQFARDLPRQLGLLERDEGVLLEGELVEALGVGLSEAAEWDEGEDLMRVAGFAFGPRTFESAAAVLADYVERRRGDLDAMEERDRALIVGRVVDGEPLSVVGERAGLEGHRVRVRAVRRAVRALVERADPDLEGRWRRG